MTKAVPKKIVNRTSEQISEDLKTKDLQTRQNAFIAGVNQLQETCKIQIGVAPSHLVLNDTKDTTTVAPETNETEPGEEA